MLMYPGWLCTCYVADNDLELLIDRPYLSLPGIIGVCHFAWF